MENVFVSEEEVRQVEAEAEQERRAALYMDDLKAVLVTPEGRRVLREWVDLAGAFSPVSIGGEATIKAAALSDYGKLRLWDMAAASPADYLRVMLAVGGSGGVCLEGKAEKQK